MEHKIGIYTKIKFEWKTIMSESNYFIKQFGNPKGIFGKLLSQIMNISNRKMYRENMKKVSDAKKILEIYRFVAER